jgi:pimeloyl-ACP methyl ester carboxylesterase
MDEALHPTVIAANGMEFSAVEAGPRDGPLVILLHGFPQGSHTWRHQVPALAARGLHVLAPDQRGYGLSSKPQAVRAYRLDELARDVVGMAGALGQERFDVVGHDWGGALVWQLLHDAPARIRRAAVINGPHSGTVLRHTMKHPTQALKGAYVGFFQLPVLPEVTLRAGDFRVLRELMRRSAKPGTFSDADLDAYQAAWATPGALTAMLNWYRAVSGYSTPVDRRIGTPVRILWGDADAALNPELAEEAAALCSDVEVTHFPGASHWLPEEQPEAVNAALAAFLTRR